MTIGVRNNIVAMASAGQVNANHESLTRTVSRLSSGQRIARIGDDASGAAVATNLSVEASSMRQAIRNTNDGLSINHTAQAGLRTAINMIGKMRELAVQSASETLDKIERKYVTNEYDLMATEMRRLTNATKYGGIDLATGGTLTIQVGTGTDTGIDEIDINKANIKTLQIVLDAQDLSTATDAQKALDNIDNVLGKANQQMSTLASQENRLLSAIANATDHIESLQASASRIEDTDYAVDTAQMTARQVRLQASAVAMSQANNMSRGVIDLI